MAAWTAVRTGAMSKFQSRIDVARMLQFVAQHF
jgi:hypothetical protein